ncbi:non-homologous end joining protein Ku [Brevibacterium linens]|uniref:Non-homologous end joining protein Ku n=2 Tax=Brevibacterium linens TaxID=1703 RepID=A0A0B9AWX4_BRELN|nr:Ku protein [Brevibacterium linens]KAB1946121.1 Ku protein [Brevibacterium linens ATCC 9172]KHS53816.1 DNA repair protein [Brevibacterium linens]SMX86054.1 DNA end-binding protein Ku [Brevibacterium linens]SMX96767.1 DNA end-binding protein Ku [Brevibacterium linens ATCC 9172]
MRAIWTGSIAFGLVNVPVKLYSATENHDVRMHQVHKKDGGRIRNQHRCEECGKTVEYDDIDKAFDDGEHRVVLTSEDFEALPAEDNDDIDVLQFVPSDEIDPIMLEKAYFLEPTSKTPKAYLLLRQTLEDTERTAIVKLTLRTRTRLAVLRVCGKVLMIQTLRWADEIRDVDFKGVNSKAKISDKELEMSEKLVESYSEDFTPEEFSDDYQVELRRLIDAKIESGESLDVEETFDEEDSEEDTGGDVIDLMEALRKSVDSSRSSKKGTSGKKSDAKKTSSKKSGAKPKKSTAKNSAPKKRTG